MRKCPDCQTEYPEDVRFCSRDGRPLGVALVPGAPPPPGTLVSNKYRVERLIGEGGMAAVYLATQLSLERPVALKVLRASLLADADALERFRREALTVARLRHNHVVGVHDFGVEPGLGAFLVLEYLEGRSLRGELSRVGPLPLDFTIEVMRQMCSAVDAAHELGIVHRDLKPDNVFLELTRDGSALVKVLDFGIAKMVSGAGGAPGLTQDGAFIGTPHYASPEQCEGNELGARSDVYSLGCVIFEMLTGEPPFTAGSLASLLAKQVCEAPKPPSRLRDGLAPEVDEAVLRALSKRPEDRFASAGEFARALAGAGTGGLGSATEPTATWARSFADRMREMQAQTIALEPDRVESFLTECLGAAKRVGDAPLAALTLCMLGETVAGRGDVARARTLLLEALGTGRAIGDPVGLAYGLEKYSQVAAATGEYALALRLAGSAAATRERAGEPLSPEARAELDENLAEARSQIGDEAAERAFAEGHALGTDEALERVTATGG